MLVINLDIGDVVLEDCGNVDLTETKSDYPSRIMLLQLVFLGIWNVVSGIGVSHKDRSLPRGRCPWRKHCELESGGRTKK